jgi:hypothetical protein
MGYWGGIKGNSGAGEARQRKKGQVSKNYLKVLIDLRAAFIAGQKERINELSEQLEELIAEEEPQLDDAVDISDKARKTAPIQLRYFAATDTARYIASYGKDFPDPYSLMFKAMRLDGKGAKLPPEEWKTTRAFVMQEVGWHLGGLDVNKRQKVSEDAGKFLDQAYSMSDDELKREFRKYTVGLRADMGKLVNPNGPMDIIKNVLEQDVAELLSNPRLLPAIAAREQYLKQAGVIP